MASTISEFTHLQIPLEDTVKATNNFANENIIGKGGFGNVYKGKLMNFGKLIDISVRRLNRRYGQGDVEFWTEISMLSSLEHENLVSIIGYCDEKNEKIIIYLYYAKGSLTMHLSDPTLKWMQRLRISKDVARAIGYIHKGEGRSDYLIHRNINSSTILLDDKLKPRLSGFEFSFRRSIDRMNQVLLCEAIGTQGYMDPETEKSGGVTHKSDVYSLGVVLFEILCGRKTNEDNRLLAPLAKFHYENGTLQDIIHPDLWDQMDPDSFEYFSKAAYSCLEEERARRPDANHVMYKLDAAYKLHGYENENQPSEENEEDEKGTWQLAYTEEEFEVLVEYPTSSNPSEVSKRLEHLRIGLSDIQSATDNFSDTFAVCYTEFAFYYKAELECFDTEYHMSVERKNKDELPKRHYIVKIERIRYKEFSINNQIEILNSCKHRNIETLLGFCDEGPNMILIFEYVSTDYLPNNFEESYSYMGKTFENLH